MGCEICGDKCTCGANDLIPDKHAYQVHKRRMAWVRIFLMAVTTVLTLACPDRLA